MLTVDDAVRIAFERNRDLRTARLAVEEAGSQVAEVWGQTLPQVDFSASYIRNISPPVSFVPARVFDPGAPAGEFISLQFGADNSWQSALSVEQALFDPGLFVDLGAVRRMRRLQSEVVRGRLHEVATRVRLTCYGLLLRAQEVHLTERSLARVRTALKETRARSRAGLATDYDVLRLQVELANLEPGLLRARNAVVASHRQLAVELDIDEPRRLGLADSEDLSDTTRFSGSAHAAMDSTDVLVRSAMAARSDLRQLELTAALRRTEVRHAQVEYLPTLSVFGSWNVQAQQNGSPDFFGEGESRATSKVAGVRVDLPLFTGLQRDARIDRRKAALHQAQNQTQLARHRAEAEVRDLAAALAESRARERAQRLAVSQAGRGFEIALARYRRGVGTQLEVTDAEVALRQSEFNHAQAAHDVLATSAYLDLAVGRVAPADGQAELAR